jgi:metal-responsive CopG/Arc/MetJ family transcriptional regulator
LISLPDAQLAQVDLVAAAEYRNHSDLVREALRRYVETYKKTQGEIEQATIEKHLKAVAVLEHTYATK